MDSVSNERDVTLMCGSSVSDDADVSTTSALPSVERTLSGWGRLPVERSLVYRPERGRELVELVHARPRSSLIARGLGRSYGDAALNAGGAVALQQRLNRMLAFDPISAILLCEAGVTIADILDTFVPRGYFPPVTPGTKYVTIGGAVACDVHGKNHHTDGSFGSFVEAIDLLTADGEVRRCSRSENSDLFHATIGGMGLTGIIVAIALRLRRIESPWIHVESRRTRDLEETFAALAEVDSRFRYTVAWIDGLARGARLGRGVVMGGDHSTLGGERAEMDGERTLVDGERARAIEPGSGPPIRHRRRFTVPVELPWSVVRRSSVTVLNRVYPSLHPDGERTVDYERFFYPLDGIRHWNRLYGRKGFVQYQVAVPENGAERTLREILDALAAGGHPSFLSVLKRFGPGNESPLSFPMEGYTLALDLPYSEKLRRLLAALDRRVVDAGGRIYLAKDALLDADTFAAMYSRRDAFLEVKARFDPDGLFSSSLARRTGLAPS